MYDVIGMYVSRYLKVGALLWQNRRGGYNFCDGLVYRISPPILNGFASNFFSMKVWCYIATGCVWSFWVSFQSMTNERRQQNPLDFWANFNILLRCCMSVGLGPPNLRNSLERPRKWRDLEQYISVDIFSQLQKLEKLQLCQAGPKSELYFFQKVKNPRIFRTEIRQIRL